MSKKWTCPYFLTIFLLLRKIMDKNLIKKLKLKLEKEGEVIEDQLKSFAKKDKKLPHKWDTRFPHFNGEAGGSMLEKAADEVEEYSTLLSIEFALENRLRSINLALEKIKKRKYGRCEKCRKEIEIERLKVYPEAKFCLKCKK